MKDIACKQSPLYQLRVALGRLLVEFQADLNSLESNGLRRDECDDVKLFLKQAIISFSSNSTSPTCVYEQLAKHFGKYADVYSAWNGHEGDDPGKPELRKRELSLLAEKRRKLFSKLACRQKEMATTPQLTFPFVNSVYLPLADLAKKHPDRFPRLFQASQLFGQ